VQTLVTVTVSCKINLDEGNKTSIALRLAAFKQTRNHKRALFWHARKYKAYSKQPERKD